MTKTQIMTKEELKEMKESLEHLKQDKLKLEKKLPKNFKRTSPIYQYGRTCAQIDLIEDELQNQ